MEKVKEFINIDGVSIVAIIGIVTMCSLAIHENNRNCKIIEKILDESK